MKICDRFQNAIANSIILLGALLLPAILSAQTFEIDRGESVIFRGSAYCPGATSYRVSHDFPSYLFFSNLGAAIDFFGNIEVAFGIRASSTAPLGSNYVNVEYEFGDFGITFCRETFDLTVVVTGPAAPTANFTAAPTFGVTPLTVRFTDQSSGGSVTNRSWNFGDGQTSTTSSPTHIYQNPGRFTVSLTLTGPGGSDAETKQDYITATRFHPEIALSDTNIELTVAANDSLTQSLAIANSGAGELYFSISATGVTGSNQSGVKRSLVNLDRDLPGDHCCDVMQRTAIPEEKWLTYRVFGEQTSGGPPWLTFAPASGVINPGESRNIVLTFRTVNLTTDTTYRANLIVASNDPDETQLTIPVSLTVPPGPNPKAFFSVSPASGFIGATFNVDASTSRDGQTPLDSLEVHWDWESDGTWDIPYSTAKTASHLYLSPGTKAIKLEVKDTDGNTALTTRTISVSDRLPAPFSLLSPTHGDTIRGLTPTLKWSTSFDPDLADTVRYRVFLSTALSFGSAATDTFAAGIDTTFILPDSLKPQTRYYWKIQASDRWGQSTLSTQSWDFFVSGAATNVADRRDLSWQFNLSQNYPNPFNPVTTISYELPRQTYVTVKVYDVAGREIGVLVKGKQIAGAHSVQFHAGDLPSGIYFCRLEAGEFVQTKKLVLMK